MVTETLLSVAHSPLINFDLSLVLYIETGVKQSQVLVQVMNKS